MRPLKRFMSVVFLAGIMGLLSPTAGQAEIQCGDTIGPNVRVNLSEDLNCAFDPAKGIELTVVGPAVLDMQGHSLKCGGLVEWGILLLESGVRIKNGRVSNCFIGVRVSGKGNHVIEKMTTIGNVVGFVVFDSQFDSQKNRIIRSEASNNFVIGFDVNSSSNYLEHNRAVQNYNGFLVGKNKNRLYYNEAINNMENGFSVRGDWTALVSNTARDNGDPSITSFSGGFTIHGGSRNLLLSNKALNNLGSGIMVLEGAVQSKFGWNEALGNSGIDLQDGNFTPPCDHNIWVENDFETSNQPCIY